MSDIIKQILSRPIQLADQVIKASEEAATFKQECFELKSKTAKLLDLLREAARTSSDLYERPSRRIIEDLEQVLGKALSLAKKCRGQGLLKRAFTIIPASAFRKTFLRLENACGNISWLLRVSVGGYLGLPPIAANEPVLCLIWEQIAIVSMGMVDDRAGAAGSLVSLARDNDRYGKLIIQEGGVGPLLKLLKDGKTAEGQENAALGLGLLGRDPESVEHLVRAGVCSVFSRVLRDGPMRVQAVVAWAVSELAACYPKCQDVFGKHNVIRLLVDHLAFETIEEHSRHHPTVARATSMHNMAVVAMANATGYSGPMKGGSTDNAARPQIAPLMGNRSLSLGNVQALAQPKHNFIGNGNGYANAKLSRHLSLMGSKARERELEDAEVKANLKAMAARALWHLAKGNSAICRSICESRALLCFTVLLEKGDEEVQFNSAMALMEITEVAERDPELRRSTFKPNSPGCKVVVDQLVKIIENEYSDILVPCIKAIGNLARTFKATETRMIGPLVKLLDKRETEVAREAAIALTKFVCIDNYLRVEHSKVIIDSGDIKQLVQLVYFGDQRVQIPALVLLSYIAFNFPESEELAKCEALTVLEWASKQPHLAQDESRQTLLLETKSRLELYQSRGSN